MTVDLPFKGWEGNVSPHPASCKDVPKPAGPEYAQTLGLLSPWVAIASLGTFVTVLFPEVHSHNIWDMIMQRTSAADADFCCVTNTFLSTSLKGYEKGGKEAGKWLHLH